MIMLKSTHKRVIENYTELITITNEELCASKKVATLLEKRNCELNTNLVATKNQVQKLEDANHELHLDLNNTNKIIKELREKIKVLEKENVEFKFCANEAKNEIKRLNTRLEVNTIARNQLRDLCIYKNNQGKAVMVKNEILINEKADAKKVWDLAMLIG